MADLRGVPDGGELWRIGSGWWVVYVVPGSQPPIPMAWKIESSDDLQALTGSATPTADRRFTSMTEAAREGLLEIGTRAELQRFGTTQPFERFVREYERQAQAVPMLQDPEVLALFAGSFLMGREPSAQELTQTGWWQSRSQAERDWATLLLQDPQQAAQQRADRRLEVQRMFRENGVDAPSRLVDHITDRWTSGRWTQAMAMTQIQGIADPYMGIPLDPEVANIARGYDPTAGDEAAIAQGRDAVRERIERMFTNRNVDVPADIDRLTDEVMGRTRTMQSVRGTANQAAGLHPLAELDITRQGEEDVRRLLLDWLGPALASQYDGGWTRYWAGQVRNNPSARELLMDELRALRMGSFPEWTNENLRYADVAPSAKALFQQVWQQIPDETDPLFMDVLRMSAPNGPGLAAASELLRRKGLERDVAPVKQDIAADINRVTGGDVRAAAI